MLVIKLDLKKGNERFSTVLLVPARCTQNSSNKSLFPYYLHSETYLDYSSVSGKISLTEMEVFPEQGL